MKNIWKYYLTNQGSTRIEVPCDSRPLSVGKQQDNLVFWVEVDADPTVPTNLNNYGEVWEVRTVMTGESFEWDRNSQYLGTVQMYDNPPLVIHAYLLKISK